MSPLLRPAQSLATKAARHVATTPRRATPKSMGSLRSRVERGGVAHPCPGWRSLRGHVPDTKLSVAHNLCRGLFATLSPRPQTGARSSQRPSRNASDGKSRIDPPALSFLNQMTQAAGRTTRDRRPSRSLVCLAPCPRCMSRGSEEALKHLFRHARIELNSVNSVIREAMTWIPAGPGPSMPLDSPPGSQRRLKPQAGESRCDGWRGRRAQAWRSPPPPATRFRRLTRSRGWRRRT